ncbi:MAG: hypothetical protein KUF82_19645 [Candidatus Thiodiazotropha sp. (ex Ctena orbiculata)]|nr:hypothetical protein [Candidatus Thiodiazotropha taylori]
MTVPLPLFVDNEFQIKGGMQVRLRRREHRTAWFCELMRMLRGESSLV